MPPHSLVLPGVRGLGRAGDAAPGVYDQQVVAKRRLDRPEQLPHLRPRVEAHPIQGRR
eukprot:CAMPEP_0179372734 /NCGR_PEP_ID=MMETSP0797-20121207/86448_1 /TAXON_ID=47934 /ORGANISM="Dinophysis acuminata, Strain DAEP01" /LENGTH=57 /DNA_ID=CAMNT_0021088735 /DNA_START=115 /DNA_END=285 /DNA_ORIENTATION=+